MSESPPLIYPLLTASTARLMSETVRYDQLPDLGRLAHWSVSSHKYGFGVENLRDGNENTFWQ